ncbi:MAG: radical SAM/SPASM domain-containing protein [Thermoanaerobaculia bacterium]
MTTNDTPPSERLLTEPFLNLSADRIYNPMTDRSLAPGDRGFGELQTIVAGSTAPADLSAELAATLKLDGWLVKSAEDLSTRFRLKYVSLEASTICNQACYFCPVSITRREDHSMTMEFYESIVAQLAAYRDTLDGVSMVHYNEPTVDKRFVDQVRMLKQYGLGPAVLTNGTGLTPDRVDSILGLGGLRYLSVNLSTLDGERYAQERGRKHLPLVLRNLEYIKDKPLAPQMDLAVLGTGDEAHKRDFEEIRALYAGSLFNVQYYEVMDRAGAVPIGLHPSGEKKRLRGCEQTGSRPVQWVHVNPMGQCVLCCQDYNDDYVVGDLHDQTLDEILAGPKMALYRRWVYGMEQAPDDFICNRCIYAITE